ncbi:MAG: hydantoinase B/oxoprolinase family protein [Verrucomicrobia bacterium]|nr:hydantoinase B/oxoprolinase family protein [Verrucomicrobiota bacterium]
MVHDLHARSGHRDGSATLNHPWQIRVDTGGTFTDCWALPPGATRPVFLKVLSSARLRLPHDPASGKPVLPPVWNLPPEFLEGWTTEPAGNLATDCFTGEVAPVIAIRVLTGTRLGEPFPEIDLRLATTRGTNALLEGKGAALAFFVTQGFEDLLLIRDQRRPDLFALRHDVAPPLYRESVGIRERLDASGRVVTPLALDETLAARCRDLLERGIHHAAVALLHSYRNPSHENALRDYLLETGFASVSLSSELAPMIKLLPRAGTAVVNACLTPVLNAFLDEVNRTSPRRFLVMTSAGGLTPRDRFAPKDSLFSGPAGGVAGAVAVARRSGFSRIIAFDMGGTSTDVARHDGRFLYQFRQQVGPAQLLAPALRIETVAAGGGSICQWTEAGLRVGPESAGADPGPACYGRGGPLTMTDVNLLLGRIDPTRFALPLGPEQIRAARERLQDLARQAGTGDPESLLNGLVEIAVEQMADSIRAISVREGADPADHVLVAFGGAGPLHACDLAEKLGIATFLVPAEAGVLSAFGLHHAAEETFAERQILRPLPECADLSLWLDDLRSEAARDPAKTSLRALAELRLQGQEATITVEFHPESQPGLPEIADRFLGEHESIFGYRPPRDTLIELVSLRVIAGTLAPASPPLPAPPPERSLTGPAIVQDGFFTLYLKEGWKADHSPDGSWICQLAPAGDVGAKAAAPRSAAVTSELFRHRFEAIVNEMGAMLERTATSTNIRERLDFSCALLDRNGNLVVNAPHIPVHLGALGLCVREVMAVLDLQPGDIAITNHPGFGGSHLPDVTLIAPVFSSGERIGFVANRAHHAEIGGKRPGSMPPDASRLEEEGVVIPPDFLFRQGVDQFARIAGRLRSGPAPTRNPAHNLADLQAQAAAIHRGVSAMQGLVQTYSSATVRSQLDALLALGRASFREAIARRPLAQTQARETLDDGTVIQVRATRSGDRLILDFTGTSPVHPLNLNATPAIVRSAVLYALRLWTQSRLPLNEGLLVDVEIRLPSGSFLNPAFPDDPARCPAVVGGNVETSQRLVDTLLKLFGIQAASQGTMNNLLFGDASSGYYETIAGGSGAGPEGDGASGLHTHMTNTAITDPEILEHRYPVRLHRFALRRNSGGAGRWHGGDGLIREFEFLVPLEVSLLTQRRLSGPYGWAGGAPGQPGRQTLIRATPHGTVSEPLPSAAAFPVQPGWRLIMETPGGGGFGPPP